MIEEPTEEQLCKEDVESGAIIDMEHALLMEPLTKACVFLENELDVFYTTSARNAIINKMSADELRQFITSLKSMTKNIRDIKRSAC